MATIAKANECMRTEFQLWCGKLLLIVRGTERGTKSCNNFAIS